MMVSFDVAQDHEPACPELVEEVEWPFHDLWIDGGETEKRPPCPQVVTESEHLKRFFWDTTLEPRYLSWGE
jgi:hypothetical protein